jgi:hypothetical protein
MSIINDHADVTPLFVESRPGMRKRIAAAVDALVALLDQIDGDADLEEDNPLEEDDPAEDDGSGEPALGASTAVTQQHAWAAQHGWPEYGEAEPSLGWSHGHGHPEMVLRGYDDDREGTTGTRDAEGDDAERSGCGDMDGVREQHGFGVSYAE